MPIFSFDNPETRLLILFGISSISMAIIGPLIWIPLVNFFDFIRATLQQQGSQLYNDPSMALLLRVDTFLYFIVLGAAGIVGAIVFWKEENRSLHIVKLLVMILYAATLYGDSCVWLITNNGSLHGLHGVHFFGFNLPLFVYIYLSIITALIAIFIAMIDHWWQVILCIPYLWNLFLAQPVLYWPIRAVLPIPVYGGSISLIALIINIAFTAFIIWSAFYVKKREELVK